MSINFDSYKKDNNEKISKNCFDNNGKHLYACLHLLGTVYPTFKFKKTNYGNKSSSLSKS